MSEGVMKEMKDHKVIAALKRAIQVIVHSFLWLIILVPILGVSAYSLYAIGRFLGAPWFIAIAFSTCFDGVALLAARYSVMYAQAGLSGSMPRTTVRVFAAIAAFLQTFHARIHHGPPGSWILWASLPIGAVLVYEIHIRWERRKALAKNGQIYPAPLPQFGFMTWILFPISTLDKFREIVVARRGALIIAANTVTADFTREASRVRNTREDVRAAPRPSSLAVAEEEAEVVDQTVVEEHRQRRQHPAPRPAPRPITVIPGAVSTGRRKRPKDIMRQWLKANGHPELGDFGRIPLPMQEEFYAAHPEARAGGDE
jgi:hypothetical protein